MVDEYDVGERLQTPPEPGEHAGLTAGEADARARLFVKHAAAGGYWRHLAEHLQLLAAAPTDKEPA